MDSRFWTRGRHSGFAQFEIRNPKFEIENPERVLTCL